MSRKANPNLMAPSNWPTWIGVGLFWLLGQLPWGLLLALGRGVGRLSWFLARKRRHIAETNIRLCFPELSDKEQRALAKASIVSTGEAMIEMAGAYFNHRVDLSDKLTVKGFAHVDNAQAQDKGVILLGMHLNSIDVASHLIGKVLSVNAVYRPNDNPVMDRVINQGRGPNVNPISKHDLRQMLQRLRKGEVVWYAPDQDYGREQAVYVPFFGQTACTITATSRLAKMGRAEVIPFAHYRLPGGRYEIVFGKPLPNFPSDDEVADTILVNLTIENYVREHPEQYLWVHRRFKHQPDGKNVYHSLK